MSAKFATIISLSAYLVLISIGLITTNDRSRSMVVPIRIAAIIIAVFFTLIVITREKYKKNILFGLIIYFGLLCSGLFLSINSNSFNVVKNVVIVDSLVTALGIVIISIAVEKRVFDSLTLVYIFYGLLAFVLTLLCGGIVLEVPPRFVFDYNKNTMDSNFALYSQGISRYFGYCAVAVAYMMGRGHSKTYQVVLTINLCFFLSLSLLGGGRGDSLDAVLIVFIFLILIKKQYKLNVVLLSGICIGIIWNGKSVSFDGIVVFERLRVLINGDYGDRDILLSQVIELIVAFPQMWIIGSGFGFFQNHFNYEFGNYPHNAVAESMIAFGVVPTLTIMLFILRGLHSCLKSQNGLNLFILFYFYSCLIESKSGYLFGGWFFTSASIVFIIIGLNSNKAPVLKTLGKNEIKKTRLISNSK